MQKRLIALFAGLMYPFGFAPYDLWPLVPASIALFFWSLRDSTPRSAALTGLVYGLALFGYGVSWLYVSVHTYGYTDAWLAVVLTGLFCTVLALFFAALGWLSARLHHSLFAFAGLWLLLDWVRSWLLTGFPWLYPGYAMIDTPLAGLAAVGGIWLVSLVTVITGLALYAVLVLFRGANTRANNPWREAMPIVIAAAVSWVIAIPINPTLWVQAKTDTPTSIALLQGNIPQDMKWLTTQQKATQDIYADLTAQVTQPALVIWPEAAITEFYQDALPFLQEQGELVAEQGGALVSGVPWRVNLMHGYQYHNSIAVLSGGQGVYHKQKLVPFGEYVPLQSLLRGVIPFLDLPMSSFTPGSPTQENIVAADLIISPLICYEALYPELVARRSHGVDLMLTVSNDAWFGTSNGPLQHFQMTRMRALETGRWFIRGTNNGVTAVINPLGQVHASAAQFERTLLQSSIVPVSGTTPFMHTGGWPIWLLSLLLCMPAALTLIRKSTYSGDNTIQSDSEQSHE
jgi:apolipoprotein N-acyltransferase